MPSHPSTPPPSRLDVQRHRLDEERATYRAVALDVLPPRDPRPHVTSEGYRGLLRIPRSIVSAIRTRATHGSIRSATEH